MKRLPVAENMFVVAGATYFYNRVVPLPLSMSEVYERLLCSYYRQPEAVIHDIQTIVENAGLFNGEESDVAHVASGQFSLLECFSMQGVTICSQYACVKVWLCS